MDAAPFVPSDGESDLSAQPASFFSNLGLAIRVLRELAAISQAQLARRAGLGKSQLSKYENGKELPKLESLGRILMVLNSRPMGFFHVCEVLDHLQEGAQLRLSAHAWSLGSDQEDEAFSELFRKFLDLHSIIVQRRVKRGVHEVQLRGQR